MGVQWAAGPRTWTELPKSVSVRKADFPWGQRGWGRKASRVHRVIILPGAWRGMANHAHKLGEGIPRCTHFALVSSTEHC